MTAAQVRSIVLVYSQIQRCIDWENNSDARLRMEEFCGWAETSCRAVTGNASSAARWATGIIGPVLAAGMGAVTDLRKVDTASGALRIFGLTGTPGLSNQVAWELVKPYRFEAAVPESAVADMRKATGLMLSKLSRAPRPADVLVELTRHHSSEFGSQMTHLLIDYFRRNALADNEFAKLYRDSLENLFSVNESREALQDGTLILPRARMVAAEWEEVLSGRAPQKKLEERAGVMATKHFVVSYWERWRKPKLDNDIVRT